MELGPSLAPELLTAADPLSRGPPDLLRPPGRGPDADSAAAPFDLLLQLLGNPLPQPLPAGESLPVPSDDAPAADALAATAFALNWDLTGAAAFAPLPTPAAPVPLAGSPLATPADTTNDTPVTLVDALRLALGAAPRAPLADSSTPPSAPDVPVAAAAAELDLPASTPAAEPVATSSAPAAAGGAAPQDLDALLALDTARTATPAAVEAPALQVRSTDDQRSRATAVTPGARSLSLASELARADAATAARTDTQLSRAFDLQAPAAVADVPVLLRSVRRDEPLPIVLAGIVGAESSTSSSPTAFASLVPQATAGTQAATAAQTAAQLPSHLGAPVDTNTARWQDALASRIHWLVDHEIGEAQIKLHPPELGALDVKISMLDDKTYVQMTAHSSAARDELSQSLPRLRELMSAGGLDLGGATVSGGGADRSGQQAAAQPIARALAFATDSTERPASQLHRTPSSSSRIDLFA